MNFIKTIGYILFFCIFLSGCSPKDAVENITLTVTNTVTNNQDSQQIISIDDQADQETTIEPVATQTVDNLACIPTDTRRVVGRVVEVLDGDTIKVRVGTLVYTIRYIGVDAPSNKPGINDYEYFGDEATQRNKELVDDQTITMIQDVSDMDNFGRMVRYVVVNDVFVNYEMVSQGYARAYLREPDVACQDGFNKAEVMAIEQGFGMWGDGVESGTAQSVEMTETPSVQTDLSLSTSDVGQNQFEEIPENPRDCIPEGVDIEYGEVVSVVDGDTIRVNIDGEVQAVQYIGVDAPQAPEGASEGEYYGLEAFERNKKLVNKKEVTLIHDHSDMDNSGRRLRYVIVDNVFVNYDMIVRGFALASSQEPDTACEAVLKHAEQEAQENMAGIWLFWSLPVIDKNATPIP